ncbi:MAG: glucose-1-phosphate adenylyltransferase, partial [Clostridia bacterium]
MDGKCVALILAGGQGSRLGTLTKGVAKPAVLFGGKYRIIDYVLTNCMHSGLDTVGVLTQYRPLELNTYIGSGQPWDLDRNNGGVYILPPYMREKEGAWYKGTANAIFQNINFVDGFAPEYVVVLSGDHIYKMDYSKMLAHHIEKKADVTIALMPVPLREAHRFGIMETDSNYKVVTFEEKPSAPKSNLASMGIYIFTWKVLREQLIADEANSESSNDFGKDILPHMLNTGLRVYGYPFKGYWKDVGTVYSLWEANMDLLDNEELNIYQSDWTIMSRSSLCEPHFVGAKADVTNSFVAEGAKIFGKVSHSVVFDGAVIEEGAIVTDSVVMTGARICSGAKVSKAIMSER